MSILTIEDILGIKKQMSEKNKKNIKIFVTRLGKEMEFSPVTYADFLDYSEKENPEATIIYNHCVNPNLKDERLIKEIFVPEEIVNMFLTPSERNEIAEKLCNECGIGNKETVKVISSDIKN